MCASHVKRYTDRDEAHHSNAAVVDDDAHLNIHMYFNIKIMKCFIKCPNV